MKHLFALLLLLLLPFAASAQKEEDFSTRFLAGHPDTRFECTTVSPQMMERMLTLKEVEENNSVRDVLRQLKSIRVVSSEQNADQLFDNARQLARRNNRRYEQYSANEQHSIYIRRRKDTIVEMVLLTKRDTTFILLNLTGTMNEQFMDLVSKL